MFTTLLPSRIVTSSRDEEEVRSRTATSAGPVEESLPSPSRSCDRSRNRAVSLPEKKAEAARHATMISREPMIDIYTSRENGSRRERAPGCEKRNRRGKAVAVDAFEAAERKRASPERDARAFGSGLRGGLGSSMSSPEI